MSFLESDTENALLQFLGMSMIEATGGKTVRGSLSFDGSTLVEAEPYGGSPIVYFRGKTSALATLSAKRKGSLTFAGSTDIFIDSSSARFDPFSLLLMLNLVPEIESPTKIWLPRLKIDGVEYPVTSGRVSEPVEKAGSEVECLITGMDTVEAIMAGNLFDFGLGRQTAFDVWEESSMQWFVQNGARVGSVKQVAQQNGELTDTFTIRIKSSAQYKFEKCPINPLIIYDPAVSEVDTTQIDVVADTNGNTYPTEGLSYPGLTLYAMWQEIFVSRCGLTGVRTNIPDFPLGRVECPMGKPYLESIKGHFGQSEPVVLEIDDYVWIIDTTMALPTGFPAPIGVTADDYQQLQISDEVLDVDGVLLTYIENSLGYDYITTGSETYTIPHGAGGDGDYLEIFGERLFREYRKFSRPGVILKKELYFERRRSSSDFSGDVETTEVRTDYNSRNRPTETVTETTSLEPDLGTPGARSSVDTSRITETLTYEAHPLIPRREYLAKRETLKEGLIMTDTENQQNGEDFEQEYKIASRSGNLKSGQTTRFGDISIAIDTYRPLKNGQVRVSEYQYNYVTKQVEKDGVPRDEAGDVSLNALAPEQMQIIVLKDDTAVRTDRPLAEMHGGEMPVIYLIPLVRRLLLSSGAESSQSQFAYVGFSREITKGLPCTVDRRGTVEGTFLLMGREITFGPSGVITNWVGKKLAVVSDYNFSDENPVGAYVFVMESDDEKIFDVNIQCKSMYEIFADPVPGVVIEARKVGDLGWTDIELGSYDLTPYDGTAQPFEIRITTGTISSTSSVAVYVHVEVPA